MGAGLCGQQSAFLAWINRLLTYAFPEPGSVLDPADITKGLGGEASLLTCLNSVFPSGR